MSVSFESVPESPRASYFVKNHFTAVSEGRMAKIMCASGEFCDVGVNTARYFNASIIVGIHFQILNQSACNLPHFERMSQAVVGDRMWYGSRSYDWSISERRRTDLRDLCKTTRIVAVKYVIEVFLEWSSLFLMSSLPLHGLPVNTDNTVLLVDAVRWTNLAKLLA